MFGLNLMNVVRLSGFKIIVHLAHFSLLAWVMHVPPDSSFFILSHEQYVVKNAKLLWHVEPLLGNDCEMTKYTRAVTK
jgi:hypothetical protein